MNQALRIVALIQARLGSSRLPGKVVADVGGRPLLDLLLRGARRSERVQAWAVATTVSPGDDRLAEHARQLGCAVFRGSEPDVLRRFAGAALATRADVVVRVTGDCPLLEATEVDRVVGEFLTRLGGPDELDYLSNGAGGERRIPHGLDVEVFSALALAQADAEATAAGHREHVTPYLYRTPGRFRAGCVPPPGPDLSALRLTVDTPADLALVQALVAQLGPDASLGAVVSLLAGRPDLRGLNASVVQKGLRSDEQHRRERVAGRLLLGRADANERVGAGHVARISALLQAWVEAGGRAVLLGRGLGAGWQARLRAAGVAVEAGDLPAPVVRPGPPEEQPQAGPDDVAATLGCAAQLGAAALALDGYAFGARYQAALAPALPLLAVDDLARWAPAADVVVNQNEGFEVARYGTPGPGTRLLVGAPYVLLRREFRVLPEPGVPRDGRRVLVTFGGADPCGLTPWVAEAALAALGGHGEVLVLAGGGMAPAGRRRLAALQAAHSSGSGPRLQVRAEVSTMAELLQSTTLALSAAGSTTWELMRCGVAALLVSVADNQRAVAAGANNAGAALDLGWHAELTAGSVTRELAGLLDAPQRVAALSRRGRQLIDGRGVWRVVDALLDAMDRREAVP